MSAADTRVSASGSGRLQSADAALYLAGLGQVPVRALEMTRFKWGVGLSLHQPTDAFLEVIPGLWPLLWKLDLAGEQRQHLQAGDIRAEWG